MKPKGSNKVRIKDIALKAGVSVGTIDRVLHNRGEINENTRKKVLQMIDELGYKPNLLAKSLASKKVYRIAVLLPAKDESNHYWHILRQGMPMAEQALADFNVQIIPFDFDATDERQFDFVVQNIVLESIDGVALNPVFKQSCELFCANLDQLGIPYVFFDINLESSNPLAFFGQNAVKSGEVAAKLLYQCIAQDSVILVLKLANRKVVSHHIKKRVQGFIAFIQSISTGSTKMIESEVDLLNMAEPADELTRLLADYPKTGGIFVPSSRGFKIARVLENLQRTDIKLIGYDLLDDNIEYLNRNVIDFIISQKTSAQTYDAILCLFHYLSAGIIPEKVNYSPIDIVIKENLEYYITSFRQE